MGNKRGIFTIAFAGAMLIAASSFTSEAAGLNAGVTAALGQRFSIHAGVYKSAAMLPTTGTAGQTEEKEEQTTICGYTNLGVANVENHLNIREGAGEEYKLVGKLPKNGGCEILETVGEWYKIQSGKVTGFVKGDYLLTGEAAAAKAEEAKSMVATINAMTVYVRKEPNTECTILAAMPKGEELVFLENLGDWVKVEVDGETGYVYAQYVDVSEELPKAMSMSELQYGQEVSSVRIDLVNYACQFVGNPYVWGGTSLTHGADCSGFTMQIYKKYGVSLPHKASLQANYGTSISRSEAKPGDLFFYNSGGPIDHVAIYIGNGQIVHASSAKTGIKISNAFYRTPCRIVRLLSE